MPTQEGLENSVDGVSRDRDPSIQEQKSGEQTKPSMLSNENIGEKSNPFQSITTEVLTRLSRYAQDRAFVDFQKYFAERMHTVVELNSSDESSDMDSDDEECLNRGLAMSIQRRPRILTSDAEHAHDTLQGEDMTKALNTDTVPRTLQWSAKLPKKVENALKNKEVIQKDDEHENVSTLPGGSVVKKLKVK